MKNIQYTAKEIEEFYKDHRIRWEQFYLSERTIFGQLELSSQTSVLDIGCGCGGLGLALKEQFGVEKYTGVDINVQAIDTGKVIYPTAQFFAADILDVPKASVTTESFDIVTSLGCVDWNVEFRPMLEKAFSYVKPGGYFVSSFRLTTGESLKTMDKSYQFINFDGKKEGEIAPYIVLNAQELLEDLQSFAPEEIRAFGYWGTPSATAVVPVEKICFAVFAIKKGISADSAPVISVDLPEDITSLFQSK